ncbi:hypothetical protein, partial [Mitsuokella jalaludinii]|uniref:hypothetical protein n=1 Tax=Mitsuokella jalaludinii TaxID=187979 RepID=UPI00307BFFAD
NYAIRREQYTVKGDICAAVYPDLRSSALGYDIFAEPKRKLAMQYSLQAHAFAVIGPIETTGGGMVMAIVNPVFLHTAGDKESKNHCGDLQMSSSRCRTSSPRQLPIWINLAWPINSRRRGSAMMVM